VKKFSLFFVVFVSFSLLFAFAGDEFVKQGRTPQYRQAFMERSPGTFDAVEYSRTMELTYNWLRSEAASLDSIITVNVTEEDLAELNSYECETCGQRQKLRVGLVKHVGSHFSFRSLDSVERTADGGMVWTSAVESPGATALRLHFTNLSLPGNAALYIYGLNGEAFGPYMDVKSSEFWSHTVTGPVAYVQLRHFGPVSENELRSISFDIEGAGYLSEKFLIPFYLPKTPEAEGLSGAAEHCPENEECVEDASCYSGGVIDDAKHAAAAMQWVAGAWIYMCSGGLIADTDETSQIPYFLTANHCISKGKDAKNLECYFQYWTASCHASCEPIGNFPRTLGSDILDSSRDGDHTLLQLWENPPAGSVFMGWTNQPVAFDDGTLLFRISHPSGMPQAYSLHEVDSDYIECSSLPVGEFIYSLDLDGATEGGSSGSPVMREDTGQIVGQLYGACGYTLEVCDPENNRTVDGAFAFYYDSVAPWLDPNGGTGGKMHVDSIVLSLKTAGPNNTCKATVTILDENSSPVEGATVTGTFSGDVSGTDSGTTDSNGVAELSLKVRYAVSTFTFCVDNVTLTGYTYDSGANEETCDTY
jgi:hypothetical protein